MWSQLSSRLLVLHVLVLGAAIAIGGCASYQQKSAAAAGAEAEAQLAHVGPRIPVEDDGLPVQLSPRNRPSEPDDPTEPWSPNYGSRSPAKTASAPLFQPVFLNAFNSTAMDRAQEEAIIRHAIVAHEMRRQ
jgi:hypothetical protein